MGEFLKTALFVFFPAAAGAELIPPNLWRLSFERRPRLYDSFFNTHEMIAFMLEDLGRETSKFLLNQLTIDVVI